MRMPKLWLCLVLGCLGAWLIAGCKKPMGGSGEKPPQTLCPVMDARIQKTVFVDYQGQRLYFCCTDCPSEFLKAPEKYFAKIAEQNVLLESVQKNCPVTGQPINKQIFADYKGRRVYFCCADCVAPFNKDPEKYLKKLQEPTDAKKEAGESHGHHQH